jgi:phage gp36-like protein
VAYITTQDLRDEVGEDKLVELTDLDFTGVEDDGRAQKAIEYAEGTFEMYISGRYVVPVVPVTPLVRGICLDLAVFHFYKNSPVKEGIYEVRLAAHDRAIKKLEAISRGMVNLDAQAITTAAPSSPSSASARAQTGW